MKIDIAGLIKAFGFFIFVGCASNHMQSQDSKKILTFLTSNFIKLTDAQLTSGSVLEHGENQIIFRSETGRTVKIFTSQFSDRKQAIQHMLARRVALIALYLDQIEPYYGLVEKRKCVDVSQPSSNFIDQDESTYFSMIFPADKLLNLFDCDKGEPPMYVQYTLLLCTKILRVFEIRDYQVSSQGFVPAPMITCD